MPLDRVNGEHIDDRRRDPVTLEVTGPGVLYGARFVVIEPDDLFRHDIRVQYVLPGKFRSLSKPRMGFRHICDDVAEVAGEHFVRLGALVPLAGFTINEDDILVQVYPELLKVAVHVQRMIGGDEHTAQIIYPREGVWSPELIRMLLEGSGKRAPLRH